MVYIYFHAMTEILLLKWALLVYKERVDSTDLLKIEKEIISIDSPTSAGHQWFLVYVHPYVYIMTIIIT